MNTTMINALAEDLKKLPANNNRFYLRFKNETLTDDQLRRFAEQYFWFCQNFIRALVGLIYNAPNDQEGVRFELIKTLYSEMGYGKLEAVHLTLLKKFLRRLGFNEKIWNNIKPIPQVEHYISYLENLYLKGNFCEAMGAEFGVEVTAATEFTYLYPGVKKYPNFSSDDIHFFAFHLIEEEQHGDWLMSAVEKLIKTPEDFALVEQGARRAAELWGNFWEGMYTYVFVEVKK